METDPEYAKAWHNLGAASVWISRHREAIEFFNRAIELDPDLLVAYRGRGTVYLIVGDLEAAIVDFSYIIQRQPRNIEVRALRADCYSRAGDHKASLQDLEAALKFTPHNHRLRNTLISELVDEYIALDEFDKAEQLCRKLKREHTLRGYAWGKLGDIATHKKDVESAVEAYSKAIAQDDNNALVLCARGNRYLELKQFEAAIEDYYKAVSVDPTCALAYYNLGNVYAQLDEDEKAVENYTAVVELEEQTQADLLSRALLNRGQIYAKLSKFELAIEDFNRSLELESNDERVHLFKGYALLGLHRFEEAIASLRIACDMKPNSQQAIHLLATAHYSQACRISEVGKLSQPQVEEIKFHLTEAINLEPEFRERVRANPDTKAFITKD